jgi:hypothetical protein
MLVQDSVILEELLELVLIIAMLSHLAKIIQGRICLVIPRIKDFLEGIMYDESNDLKRISERQRRINISIYS